MLRVNQFQTGRSGLSANRIQLPAAQRDDLVIGRGRIVELANQCLTREERGERGHDSRQRPLLTGIRLRCGKITPGGADTLTPADRQDLDGRPRPANQRIVGAQRICSEVQPVNALHCNAQAQNQLCLVRPGMGQLRPKQGGQNQQRGHRRQHIAIKLLGRRRDRQHKGNGPDGEQPGRGTSEFGPALARSCPAYHRHGPGYKSRPEDGAKTPKQDNRIEERPVDESHPAEEVGRPQRFIEMTIGATSGGCQHRRRRSPKGRVDDQ